MKFRKLQSLFDVLLMMRNLKFRYLCFILIVITDISNGAVVGPVNPPLVFTLSFTASDFNGFGVSCNGSNDGSIDMTINGGIAPFDILWSNGETTEDISGLAAGNYIVTVIDAALDTTVDSVFISEPDIITLNLASVDANSAPDGEASVSPTGGAGGYTYLWSNAAITDTITGLLPGNYTITVTDVNFCTATDVAVIQNAQGPCAVVTDSVFDVSCFGFDDGAIYIDVFASIAPVSYLWSDGSTSQDITSLAPGTYTVTITDVIACTATETFVINEPDTIVVTLTADSTTCGNDNGGVSSIVTGGISTYDYLWSNGAVTPDITAVATGNYTLTVTDQNGCIASASSTVSAISPPVAILDSVRAVQCFGNANGAVYISVNNGTTPFTFLWSNAATSEDITGLLAGTYTVTVTDANLCISTVSGNVTQPATALNDSLQVTSSTCGNNNGSVSAFGYNGTGPYTYLWSTGATTSSISGLASGSYTVTITDANLCNKQDVGIVASAPSPVVVLDSVTQVKCFGSATGRIYISVSGGTSPFTYLWSNGSTSQDITSLVAGSYTVTVTDANLCTATLSQIITEPAAALNDSLVVVKSTCGNNNGSVTAFPYGGTSPYTFLWSTGATTSSITGLSPATYTLTLTDANSCIKVKSASVSAASVPTAVLDSVRNVKCFGGATGSVYITRSGGVNPVTYLWSNGTTASDLINVVAGTYTVTLTDANACTFVISGVVVSQPAAALNDSVQVTSAACGGSNGTATIFPYGGTSPYTFLWNGGQTTSSRTGLPAGNYTVTVTDFNLCTKVRVVNVTNLNGPVVLLDSVSQVNCFNGSDGAAFVSVTGGTGTISYLWSTGATTQDLLNVSAGTYTVTATDQNLCTSSTVAVIGQPAQALNDSTQKTNDACNSGIGSATVYPYGGTSPYTYLWNGGQTTQTISGLNQGNYTVTVTDANACTIQATVAILNLSGPTANLDSVKSVSCFGGSNGAVYITPAGGNSPYTYLWSNAATTQDISGLTAGTYTVTVTDANLCTATVSGIVTQPAAALNDSIQKTNATCGNANGSLTVFAYNGTSPYTYLWSTGATTSAISGLNPGNYTITVTDANLCTRVSTASLINIAGPSAVLDSVTAVKCFGQSTGALYISVSGGTNPLTYLWSTGATTQDLINVGAGNYTVTVTDANNCTSVVSSPVTQPAQALNDSVQVTNSTCGNANGAAIVFPFGGTSPYSYLWNTGQTTQSVSGLASGSHTVTITDGNLCTRQRTVNVNNISGPSAVLDSVKSVGCFGLATGAVYISTSGGTSPLSYLWSTGAVTQDLLNVVAGNYTVTVTDANLCTAIVSGIVTQPAAALNDSLQKINASCGVASGAVTVFPYGGTGPYSFLWSTGSTLSTIFNLTSGTYTVTVTDANGCTKVDVANVTGTNGPVVAIDSVKSVKCFGGNTGGIYISVSGGTIPYSYLWSNGSTSQDLTNVVAGPYTVTVTDDNGCSSVVGNSVSQPTQITATLNTTDATCGASNGSISSVVSGGVNPYAYLWNTGAVTPGINSLAQGVYTLTVTDLNNCSIQVSDTVFNSNGPVIALDSITNVLCNGQSTGAIYISVSGGTGILNFLWSTGATTEDITSRPAGAYTITVTDQNSCTNTGTFNISQNTALNDSANVVSATCGLNNGSVTVYPYGGVAPYTYQWSNLATTQIISPLAGGTYTVTVTDSVGCTYSNSYNVLNSSVPVISTDSTVDVLCFGNSTGAIYTTVTGGTGPYVYNWSNSVSVDDNLNIPAGVYTLIITDNFLCTDTAVYTINQPTQLQDSLLVNPAKCGLNNGSSKAYPYGGTGPYTYLWSNGQTSQTAVNLAAGIHTVTITDFNGCQVIETINVPLIPIQVITTDSITDVLCNGNATGAIYISVSAGGPPFTYLWSNTQTTQDITGLTAGTYTVTVTDSLGCVVTQTMDVNEPDAITDSVSVVDETCGLANGSVAVTLSGGNPSYTYLWSNNQITPSISNLVAGTYTLTATDLSGCIFSNSYLVNGIGGPSIQSDSTFDATCFGGNDGAIYISIINGTAPFTFLWSNLETTEDLLNISAGNYQLTVTDSNNCQQLQSFVINEPTQIEANDSIVNAACGDANGSIILNPSGGTPPYTYLWSNLQTTSTVQNLLAGLYSVTITDSVGCNRNFQYNVLNQGAPVIALDSTTQILCAGDSAGAIYISVSGGVGPYSYNWSNFAVTEDITALPAGIYTVTVTDANNCIVVYTDTISEPPPITVNFNIVPANCNASNGSVEATISGGTGNYTLLWSNNAVTNLISGLTAATYTLTITDQNNCQVDFQASVTNLSAPQITVVDSGNVSCNGAADGFIVVNVTGGQQPYNYSWTNTTQTGDSISGLAGNTTYTLTITDSLGCVTIRPVFISQPQPIVINSIIPQLNDTFNLTCAGSNDGSIKVVVSGGTTPYQYIWSNLALTDSIGSLAAGNYTVTVTDANSCTTSRSFTLTQPPLLVSNAGSNNSICGVNSDTLNAIPPSFGTAYWTVVSGTGTFADSTQANTIVTDLSNGVNVFQWVVTDGICAAVSQVVIDYSNQITAIAGINRTVCADSVLLTATAPQFGIGYWQVINSSGTLADSTKAVTLVSGLGIGYNVFRWVVINGTCADSADLVIVRNDPLLCIEEIELPTGFTPNNDGYNDYFIIKGAEENPDNSFVVYNRWGNKVYEKSGYRNEWDGVNDSGNPLPEGTYFIIFKVRSTNKIITSYVDLRR